MSQLDFRFATPSGKKLLAKFNQQPIQDEGHRNRMSLSELEDRMQGWLEGQYDAVIFSLEGNPVAYALYCTQADHSIYLRQFFVVRDKRRFSWHWNEFLWPLVVTNSPDSRPLTERLVRFTQLGGIGARWSPLTAATLLVAGPPLQIFLIFQRRFIQSCLHSGIK